MYEYQLPRSTEVPQKIQILNTNNTLKGVRKKIVQHTENCLWTITRAYGDNYYDVQKTSTMIFEFNFLTGTLDSNGNYSNENPFKHTRVWNASSARAEVGDQCLLDKRNDNYEQKVYIKKVVKRARGEQMSVVPPLPGRLYTVGDWMQASANPFLSFCGVQSVDGEIDGGNVSFTADFSASEAAGALYTLGVVSSEAYLFWCAYHRSSDTSAPNFDELVIYAFSDVSSEVTAWRHYIPFSPPVAPDLMFYPSNLFYDPDQRVLTILAHQLWSVVVPSDGSEPSNVSNRNTSFLKYCGAAWDGIVRIGGIQMEVFERNEDNSIDLDLEYDITGFFTDTGQPFSPRTVTPGGLSPSTLHRSLPTDKERTFYYPVLGKRVVDLEPDSGVEFGPPSVFSGEFQIQLGYHVKKSLTSSAKVREFLSTTYTVTDLDLLDATDAAILANGSFVNTSLPANYESSPGIWSDEVFKGRITDNQTHNLGLGANYANQQRYFSYTMPSNIEAHMCPIEESTGTGSSRLSRIPGEELSSASYVSRGCACAVNSQGVCAFAAITPAAVVRLPGFKAYWYVWNPGTGTIVNPFTVMDTPEPGERTQFLEWWHVPTHLGTRQTLALFADKAGELSAIKLSKMWNGFTFSEPYMGTSAVSSTNLDYPENVWQVACFYTERDVPERDVWCFLHDERAAKDEEPRPAVTVFSPFGDSKLSEITQLGDLTKRVDANPNIDGTFVYTYLSPPQIRLNLAPEGSPFHSIMIVGIWLRKTTDGDIPASWDSDHFKTLIYVYDMSNPSGPALLATLEEARQLEVLLVDLPRDRDFSRMVIVDNKILWPGQNIPGTWQLKKFFST